MAILRTGSVWRTTARVQNFPRVCLAIGAAVATMALATAGCSDAGNADPTTDTGDAEPTATASAGDDQAGTYHFEVELGDRTYDIYTPPMQDLQPLTPAVLAFHGMPGSPDTISRDS